MGGGRGEEKNYYKIRLRSDNFEPVNFTVHRLVAELFCEKPEGMNQVDHIDGNKHNNHYTNLEWVNNSINQKRAYAMGLNLGRTGKPASEETKKKIRLAIKEAWENKDEAEKEEFREV